MMPPYRPTSPQRPPTACGALLHATSLVCPVGYSDLPRVLIAEYVPVKVQLSPFPSTVLFDGRGGRRRLKRAQRRCR